MIFISTTYHKKANLDLKKILSEISSLKIDGVEIGSVHKFDTRKNYKKIIKQNFKKKILIHNFFTPSKNKDFVINIASNNQKIRDESVDLVLRNIDFAESVGSNIYTFHPGFLSSLKPQKDIKKKNYDFNYSDKAIFDYKKGFKNMVISLKKITQYAKNKNIKIAIETEGSIQKKEFLLMQKPNEFIKLFKIIPKNLWINFNVAHSYFASKSFNFNLNNFIKLIKKKIIAVELSCNNGINDQHLPINVKSKNLKFIRNFKNIPIILEFRHSSLQDLKKSINILNSLNEK